MVTNQSPSSLARFPDELLTAVAIDGARDGDGVGIFLSYLGIRGTPEKPVQLPREFLLDLAAALRLLVWEAQGFFFHIEAGLPEAQEAIGDVFRRLSEHDFVPTRISVQVLRLFVERFAWTGQQNLGADMVLDELTDDVALDALAEYLWASRHAGSVTGGNLS